MIQIYYYLNKETDLEECLHDKTQNANESFDWMIRNQHQKVSNLQKFNSKCLYLADSRLNPRNKLRRQLLQANKISENEKMHMKES